jgi:hypothetical protein
VIFIKYIKRGYMHPIKKEFCPKCGRPVEDLAAHISRHTIAIKEANIAPKDPGTHSIDKRAQTNKKNYANIRARRNQEAINIIQELGGI